MQTNLVAGAVVCIVAVGVAQEQEKPKPGIIRELTGHHGYITSVAFSSDSRLALSASSDGTVRLWEVESGREVRRFEVNKQFGVTNWAYSAALSPDGRYVACGSGDTTIWLWDAKSGQEIRRFRGHTDWVEQVTFMQEGRRIISAGKDGTVRLWEAETGKELVKFKMYAKEIAVSPEGRQLLVSNGNTTELWDVESQQKLHQLGSYANSLCFSPDGRYVAKCAKLGNDIEVWEARTGNLLQRAKGYGFQDVAFSSDGKRLVSAKGVTLGLWDATNGDELGRFEVSKADVLTKVAHSPKDTIALLGTRSGKLVLFRLPK